MVGGNDTDISVGIDSSDAESGLSDLEKKLSKIGTSLDILNARSSRLATHLRNISQINSAGFSTLNQNIQNLSTGSHSAAGNLSNMGNSIRNGNIFVGIFNRSLGTSLGMIRTLGPVGAAAFGTMYVAINSIFAPIRLLTNNIDVLFTKLRDTAQSYQGFMVAVDSQFGSGKGQEYWEWLVNASNALGTNLAQNATQFHQLAAAMASIDKTGNLTKEIFSGISIAGAVMQKSQYSTGLALQAVQQIMSKNKPSWEELRQQLAEHIPGATDALVQSLMRSKRYVELGATDSRKAWAQLNTDIKKGAISSAEVVLRISNELKSRYGDALQTPSKLLISNINLLKNGFTELFARLSQSSIVQSLNRLLQITSVALNTLTNNIDKLTSPFSGLIDLVTDFISALTVEDITYFVDIVAAYFTALYEVSKLIFGGLKGGAETAGDALKLFLRATMESMAITVDFGRRVMNVLSTIKNVIMLVSGAVIGVLISPITTLISLMDSVVQKLPFVSKSFKQEFAIMRANSDQAMNNQIKTMRTALTGLVANMEFDGSAAQRAVAKAFDGVTHAITRTNLVAKDYKATLKELTKTRNEADLQAMIDEINGGNWSPIDPKKKKGKAEPPIDPAQFTNPYKTDLESLKDSRTAELEALRVKYDEQTAFTIEAQLQRDSILQGLAQQHQDKLLEIAKNGLDRQEAYEQLSLGNKIRFYGSALTDLVALSGSSSDRLMKISQGAAAVDALISTYQGQAAALRLGWPQGVLAAAKIGAAGFGFVKKIKLLSKGSSGSASTSIGSTTLPAQQIAETSTAPKQLIEFNFQSNGRTIFREDEVIDMMNQIRDRINDGDNRMGSVDIS